MNEPSPATRIHEVGTIFIPVADQERALAFYCNVLGFEKRADFAQLFLRDPDGNRFLIV